MPQPVIAPASLLKTPLRMTTWNANSLLHQVPRGRQRRLRVLEKLSARTDVVLIQECHCTAEEFVIAAPRLAEIYHIAASGGSASTGGVLTLIAERLEAYEQEMVLRDNEAADSV